MSRTLAYAACCSALVAVGVGGTWPLLDAPGRSGALTAAAVALPLQVIAFAALHRGWGRTNLFLAAWAAGTLLRMATVFGVAVLVTLSGLPAAPTLLALAGFFLGMLLLEPLFLRRNEPHLAEGK